MKKTYRYGMRRAVAALVAGLALGGFIGNASAQRVYQMKSNYPSTNVAPYNAGGGVPCQPYITSTVYSPVSSPTNCTLSWYGMRGWYTVLGGSTASLSAITNPIGSVEATEFAWTTTVPTTNSSSSFITLSLTNYYSGQGYCSGCHGDKYTPWTGTAHASALASLAAIGQNNNPTCLQCHTVGFNQPTGYTNGYAGLANVGCESCHGPAGWHKNSDHTAIHPAVSLDPAICGSCHQGSMQPTYAEYTNRNTAAMGVLVTGVSHATGSHSGSCSVCHAANNRMAMVNEYYDRLAGNPHPLSFFTNSSDQTVFGAAACATCHDPHSSNQVAQLRYPIFSTNYYSGMAAILFSPQVVITNFDGTFTTNTVTLNTAFDAQYNPNIQVCGQCHAGGRGMRWDGNSYAVVTNTSGVLVVTNDYVTLIPYTNVDTSIGYSTNSTGFSVPHYPVQYNVLIGQLDSDLAANGGPANATHAHTTAPNQCADCHVPSYAVNAGTNVTGHSFMLDYNGCLASCHSSYTLAALQAKVLNQKTTESNNMARVVSLLNQWATNVAPAILRTNYVQLAWEFPSPGAFGTKTTNFVATSTNTAANTTNYVIGSTFVTGFGVTNMVIGVKSTFVSNSITYALSATNKILGWTNSIGINYFTGPPSKWNGSGGQPSGTNDNVQLAYVPQDIRIARFSLYCIYEDQSYGVHNPTYAQGLLDDAAARVTRQFAYANFSASTISGFAPLTVNFTNLGATSSITGYTWNFGDGQDYSSYTTANPAYTYSNPGTYAVTFTATTATGSETLVKTNYIYVLAPPTVTFAADQTNVAAGTTVNFTNTSTNTANVFRWSWYPMSAPAKGQLYYANTGEPVSFTYTNAGSYTVALVAYCPGYASGSYVRVTNTVPAYINVVGANFAASPTNGLAPLTVSFTNLSGGASSYLWSFGNGSTSTSTNPVYTYTNPGSYTVTLSAINGTVTNTLALANYIVANPKPVAGFTATPSSGLAPLTVNFTNTSTNATGYLWTFNLTPSNAVTSTATSLAFTFTNVPPAGYPVVTLLATNAFGGSTATNSSISVQAASTNNAYFVTSTGATNFAAGTAVTFIPLGTGITSCYWTFGDGGWSTSISPTHTYSTAGTNAVWLTVNGLTTYMRIIYVYQPPTAGFTAGPLTGTHPLTVNFTNTSANATGYLWTFNLTSSNAVTSTAVSPVFTFTNAAPTNYPVVTLQASNPIGSATATNASIHVN